MKKFALRNLVLLLCLTMAISFTGCASEAKKAMDESVDTANELLEKDAEPFDAETETALEKAVKTSEEAEDDDAYKKVKKDIDNAIKAYQDSVKQQKQVTERKIPGGESEDRQKCYSGGSGYGKNRCEYTHE